ncbi:cytochrome P450 [Dentipellis sp. KUC8613]|nr:cytochrome P450 [Dentipellis sp. KUC8613]
MDVISLSADVFRSPLFYSAIIALSAFCAVRYVRVHWRNLPPGPKGISLLCVLLRLHQEPWKIFKHLGKEHGPLVYLNVLGQPLIVLNSPKVAADLLDRRAGNYSDRPRNIVAGDLMTGGLFLPFNRYGALWRRMRKAAHEGLHKGVITRFLPTQYDEALVLTCGVLSHPQNWDAHLRRASASATMSLVYDTPPIESEDDPSVKSINDCVARLTRAAAPGAHFVEIFPWMMYIPDRLASWKRVALDWFDHDSAIFENLFNAVRDHRVSTSLAAGTDRPSLAATLIENSQRHGLSELENSWLSATLYAAGAETTSGVMAWWMLAMVAYPETQRRAQAELDAVVGRSRLPKFSDFRNLPYVRAMVKEALRWQPVDRLGLPHRSTEDDWYDGYFIPAGSIVIANVWQINRDPEIYGADADEFNPARHLNSDGQVAPGPADMKEEGHVTYGFGRRICIGRHAANNSLFIDIAMMLWAMNIEQGVDDQGRPLPFDLNGFVDHGLVVRPVPFECKITPRFPEAVSLLQQEKELIS